MASHLGLALAPWGALGGGRYKTEEQRKELEKNNEQGRKPFSLPSDGGAVDRRVTAVLDKIAKSKGPHIGVTGIALAYVTHKAPDVFPIVGGRKIQHLKENIAALTIRLSDEEIKEIEDAGEDFKYGFPHNFLGGGEKNTAREPGEVAMLKRSGHYDFHERRKVYSSAMEILIDSPSCLLPESRLNVYDLCSRVESSKNKFPVFLFLVDSSLSSDAKNRPNSLIDRP